jgi:hypothetical protein
MVKITVGVDCGNAPKKLFLRDLNIAFVEGDIDAITETLSDDILWVIAGDRRVQGKDAFLQTFKEMMAAGTGETEELVIHKIITHGREAAVNGEVRIDDGRVFSFCDVYEFSGAKGERVKAMWSYMPAAQTGE